ncbi:MAG TPA: tyrosine recombinase, partial [Verrucomicrobiales bacterium]|nr:tyrosine recombinase [Verrucomicrobiales bacterium]
MNAALEDFLQHIRHEKGQSIQTQKTYATLLGRFVQWAESNGLAEWESVNRKHLTEFLKNERNRKPQGQGEQGDQLSPESVYLQIAALRAFYQFAASEEIVPANIAENLSLPRRWKRLPKALSDIDIEKLLQAPTQSSASELCTTAILELAYASGLRLAELRNLRLEQLQLKDGFVTVIGKGNKERVVPLGQPAIEAIEHYLRVGRPELVKSRTPANVFLTKRGTSFAQNT